jgi:superfamily I DNA/RNA helicase
LSFLDELNPQQREAVETTDGPVLILAGAGSGKTRVITFRIAYLIEKIGVMPEAILAMTFTNKAAAEMAERVGKLVGGLSIAKPVISTFHSFCVRVLRRDIEALRIPSSVPGQPPIGLTKNFVIYDESDQQQVVKSIMRRLGLDDKQLTPRNVLSRISWAKNHMLDPQEIYLQSADPKTEKIAHIFEEYRKELLKANAMDFDDLLLEAMRLLKSVAAVREYYNRRFQYLLVDEYQDTNRPQYELMRLLAGAGHNVCAVGDEDQSIYSWRGADIRNILEFEADFPEAKIVRLEENYRSTQNILGAASAVVANNVRRKGKNLWTSRQGGAKIGYYEAPDGENEALFAADTINKYVRQAGENGETARAAVLYRTNSQSRLFEEAMRRYQLKYHVVGGFSFYERAEIKDLISYLKVIQNPDDSVSLLRVINSPVRGIGKTTIEMLERLALETGLSMWGAVREAITRQLLPGRALAALKSFRELIEDGRAMLAGTYTERLLETAGEQSQATTMELLSAGQSHAGLPRRNEERADTDFNPDNFTFDFGANAANDEAADRSAAVPAAPGQAPQMPSEGTYEVSPALLKKIEPLQKKALELGLAAPFEFSEEAIGGKVPLGSRAIRFHRAQVTLNGWTFVAAIRHREGESIVQLLPGNQLPEKYHYSDAKCDQCKKNIPTRKSTFIVCHENGDVKQVGSTCLKDFLGHPNPEAYARYAEGLCDLEEALSTITLRPQGAESTSGGPSVNPASWDSGDHDLVEHYMITGEKKATTADLLKFLIDRTGYIKQLEEEDTPESYSRIENLRELVNAALDSRDRGETLDQFLDHAALVSDADQYDEHAQITLMTLHAAKGLEFPLVVLAGMEEGLFPHSRTMLEPDAIEEERRLCYVGMTRAMDTLILSRAVYRRRYGTDMPEASVPSRFLEEVPPQLVEELGGSRRSTGRVGTGALARPAGRSPAAAESTHYSYEDEDQSAAWNPARVKPKTATPLANYNSIDNIAEFFASRGKKFHVPKMMSEEPKGRRGFRPGQKVKHPKYGEGTVYQREGDGEDAKITVQFPRFGLKKLVERYAQLEKA